MIPNPRTWFGEIRLTGGGKLSPCLNQRDYKDPPIVIEFDEEIYEKNKETERDKQQPTEHDSLSS